MQAMRDLLRTTLGKSLNALEPVDRLAAAWPVAAGHAIAGRSSVTELDPNGCAVVTVADKGWLTQLESMPQLKGDLARISGVPLTDILFLLPAGAAAPPRVAPPKARKFNAARKLP